MCRLKCIPAVLFIVIVGFLQSCRNEILKGTTDSWKAEIVEAEKSFAEMAMQDGIEQAFLAFAADDAVMLRDGKLIKGKDAIRERFSSEWNSFTDPQLTWTAEFVDVASSGDLGYTYGPFVFSYSDSTGARHQSGGIFHTVWKRQQNGSWKFVWD